MKISNSKKQLAKIISENGGWREGAAWAAQDRDIAMFSGGKPSYHSDCSEWASNAGNGCCVGVIKGFARIPQWHQTLLSRDEYLHLYPAPVEVVVENKTTCHLTVTDKPTIEQLAADYRNVKDYADRKQQEADVAKADAEAKLAELVAAGKARGLVLSVAEPEQELVITDWRDLQVGDEIEVFNFECPEDESHRKNELMRGVCVVMTAMRGVVHIELKDNLPKAGQYWNATGVDACEFKFIRRPAQGATNA